MNITKDSQSAFDWWWWKSEYSAVGIPIPTMALFTQYLERWKVGEVHDPGEGPKGNE